MNTDSNVEQLTDAELDLVAGGFDSSSWGFGTRLAYLVAASGAAGPVAQAGALAVTAAWLVS